MFDLYSLPTLCYEWDICNSHGYIIMIKLGGRIHLIYAHEHDMTMTRTGTM
jgi:hypothetical protein